MGATHRKRSPARSGSRGQPFTLSSQPPSFAHQTWLLTIPVRPSSAAHRLRA